ncbi:hypothetical protein D6C85_06474 [Aureobasidium pullulans]|uniref:Uncharacterized protein n=1 Tax=Aureobasidium pullulans TaxID=5580 RepID=A0A4S9WUK5_AURPU|nr:hypothetical protein D6C85_06474 [Aureobasidium pullulans]
MRQEQAPWTQMLCCESDSHGQVTRRNQRAEISGNPWSDVPIRSAQPTHVRIAPKAKPSATKFAGNTPDLCDDSPDGDSDVIEVYTPDLDPRDGVFQNHALALVPKTATIAPMLFYPDEHLIPVKFFSNIFDYFRGACDNGHFVRNDSGDLVSHVSSRSSMDVSNFYKCCITAIDLLERGYYAQGFALVSNALWLVERLLEVRDPKLIDTICDVAVLLLTKGWDQVYEILMERICCMVQFQAIKNKEQHHPWAQLFAWLQKLPTSQALEILRRGWKCGLDQLEDVNPGHSWEWLNMNCSSDYPLRMGGHVAQLHQDVLSAWFEVPEPSALSSMRQQFACGNVLYYDGNYREALGAMESIIYRCAEAREHGEKKWMALEIEALEVSSRCHSALCKLGRDRGDILAATTLLESAIERSGVVWGAESATTIALQHNLWLLLLEQNRESEAELLRSAIDTVMIKPKSATSSAPPREDTVT